MGSDPVRNSDKIAVSVVQLIYAGLTTITIVRLFGSYLLRGTVNLMPGNLDESKGRIRGA